MILDRRAYFRRNLNPVYLPFYNALCDILPREWQPISGFRTFKEQAELYARGRGNDDRDIVTNSPAGMSMHNYGLASDWGYFEDGDGRKYVSMYMRDPRWKEYADACEKVGLRTLSWERPHNEYKLPFDVARLKEAFEEEGIGAVCELIRTGGKENGST